MLRSKRIQTLEERVLSLKKQVVALYLTKEPNSDRRHQAHTLKWRQEQSEKMKAYWAARKAAKGV